MDNPHKFLNTNRSMMWNKKFHRINEIVVEAFPMRQPIWPRKLNNNRSDHNSLFSKRKLTININTNFF